jgi:spore coat polysaccharide biosynthesis protein SpsF
VVRSTATLGIIDVHPGKELVQWHVARKLGGRSVLELIVRRVTDCQRVDAVVVAAGRADARRVAQLVPPDVPVVTCQSGDMLRTFVTTATQYEAGAVVRVRANYPFIDPFLIDRLATTAEEYSACDYITYCSQDGRPALRATLGLFGQWCSAAALRTADAEAVSAEDRRDPLRYIASHPERFRFRLMHVPRELDRDDVRLCIHREEDWEFAQTIYDALGPERLDWQEIAGLLVANPDLRRRMAVSNQADEAGNGAS